MSDHDRETGEIVELRIPAAIAAAIVAVKKQVRAIANDERNPHGGYSYVSVDRLYEIIGRLMADAGLALLIDELSSDIQTRGERSTPWLFVHYALRFVHESGAISPALHRSCALPISGPQAFGAAQSYIEKQFLRQVFKVPTGERDADDTKPSDDAPAGASGARTAPRAASGQKYPQRPQAAPAASETRQAATKRYIEIRDMIRASKEERDLEGWIDSPVWKSCRDAILKAEESDGRAARAAIVADEAMDLLKGEIERARRQISGMAPFDDPIPEMGMPEHEV